MDGNMLRDVFHILEGGLRLKIYVSYKYMPCQKCKKKCGVPIDCLYCEGSYCPRCIHLPRHECPGIQKKIEKELNHLEKKVEFKPDAFFP